MLSGTFAARGDAAEEELITREPSWRTKARDGWRGALACGGDDDCGCLPLVHSLTLPLSIAGDGGQARQFLLGIASHLDGGRGWLPLAASRSSWTAVSASISPAPGFTVEFVTS
jgi:hypothetical protein